MKRTLVTLVATVALGMASLHALADDEKDGSAAATTEATDTMATPSAEPATEAKDGGSTPAEPETK